ncbi:MAG: DUF362 domain-containing protein [Candidatus Eiseniibacteriota bacterium]|nr:MAG: DUF362 domain-containing protein [Candidatus Eisenbacteria bacterium]
MSLSALALGVPLVTAAIALRRRLTGRLRTTVSIAGITLVVLAVTGMSAYFLRAGEYSGPTPSPPSDYRANVFRVSDCPENPTGDRFLGLDNLLALMGREGLKFYKSSGQSLVAGPDGIIAADDVVIIKINYQWDQRGGTNVDLLRGLIRRIVDHPDSFVGEVVVCENAQFNSVSNFDRSLNNAQNYALSPHDVVVAFQTEGHNVSHYDWTSIRYNSVSEYSDGNMADGYIVYPYDLELQGRVSYPKFQTTAGTYISLKNGVWNPDSLAYDRERLKFINVPVLKSHHAVYGATVCVKNYMGVVTRELNTNSHSAIRYGILGAHLGEIRLADLNLLDCIWINANPNEGPWTSYEMATRTDELVASVDPVAADIWSVKNILVPAFILNGHLPPWPSPSADPDDPNSAFREYLDNSMYQILSAGYSVTNDLSQIDAISGSGGGGDFDGDSDVDSDDYTQFVLCFTGEGGGPIGAPCFAGDFDADSDVDCVDWRQFQFVWTDSTEPADLPECPVVGVEEPRTAAPHVATSLSNAFPNPISAVTRIHFTIGTPGNVTVRVFDVSGRAVRTLVDESKVVGEYSVVWDRRDDSGAMVGSGVFFYQLDASGFRSTRKIVVLQ